MKTPVEKLLSEFVYQEEGKQSPTIRNDFVVDGITIPVFINEFWTSRQRQAHSLHEVSYRACFKPQLPKFFIERFTRRGETVYDPFAGRGTTIIEAALLGRNIIANDVNPLSALLSRPRLLPPTMNQLQQRLDSIRYSSSSSSDISLSMFFHKKTLSEIVSLRKYLTRRKNQGEEDSIDRWIRMVATNRLTGHSKGFFSVYTLPPNQAMSAENQRRINNKNNRRPEYRDTKAIILKKSAQLLGDVEGQDRKVLKTIHKRSKFLVCDARSTSLIPSQSVKLTVTSPPFLNIVQYAQDNWLRCWFNTIHSEEIGKRITMSKTVEEWCSVMEQVLCELYRVTKKHGYVAFEVGEVRKGKIHLEEYVAKMGLSAGFHCEAVMINRQHFTKTANIWGVSNNHKGTNSNRIVVFRK